MFDAKKSDRQVDTPATSLSDLLRDLRSTLYLGARPLPLGTCCSLCGEVIQDDALYYRFTADGSVTCEACCDKKKSQLRREASDG